MTNLQQLKKEVMKEVKWLFLLENDNEAKQESFIKIKDLIDSLITKAYEEGKAQAINDTIDIIASEEGWEESADYYNNLIKNNETK